MKIAKDTNKKDPGGAPTSIRGLIEREAEVIAEMQRHGEKAVKESFKDFFEEHPEVGGVHWEQFTPYFMDGDPCVFSVYELTFLPRENYDKALAAAEDYEHTVHHYIHDNGNDVWVDYEEIQGAKRVTDKDRPRHYKTANGEERVWYPTKPVYPSSEAEEKASKLREFSVTIQSADQLMNQVFGDHAQVYVYPNEIVVEEYGDHH